MHTTRRKFINTSLTGGIAAALPGSVYGIEPPKADIQSSYAMLDDIIQKKVLK